MKLLVSLSRGPSCELPKNKGLIDPALYTLDEYLKLVNPQNKSHPPSAYVTSLDELNSYHDAHQIPVGWQYLNSKKVRGLELRIYAEVSDKFDGTHKYVKHDENGDIARDASGEIEYFSVDELKKVVRLQYDYSFYVVHEGKIVAQAIDEWGCVLIQVATEFQGFGLGKLLTRYVLKYQPSKDTGGFTQAGGATYIRTYAELVKEAMRSGRYSKLIKAGKMTAGRALEIIRSVNLKPTKKATERLFGLDLGTDPTKWLLMDSNGAYIIYDSRLKELAHESFYDEKSFWIERFIIGMIYANSGYSGGTDLIIHQFFGPDNVRKFLLKVQLSETAEHGERLRIEKKDLKYLDKSQVKLYEGINSREVLAEYTGPTMNVKGLIQKEKQFRRSFDRYGEFEVLVAEKATAMAD